MRPAQDQRVLVITANPFDTERIRVDQEARTIRESLGRGSDLHIAPAGRPRDVAELLLALQPTILHFAGHSSLDGLQLESVEYASTTLPGRALAGFLSAAGATVTTLVLNSCHSEELAECCLPFVWDVVGTSAAVPDDSALHFADGFYRAVAHGRPTSDAFQVGLALAMAEASPADGLFVHRSRLVAPAPRRGRGSNQLTVREIVHFFDREPVEVIRALADIPPAEISTSGVKYYDADEVAAIFDLPQRHR